MGLLEILTAIFVTLKLIEVIDWSWWLVFSPMYVYVVVFILWIAFVMFMAVLSGVLEGISKTKRRK